MRKIIEWSRIGIRGRLTFPNPDAAPDVSRLIAETTVANLGEDSPGGFPRSLKRLRDKRGFVTYFWYDADGNIVQTRRLVRLTEILTMEMKSRLLLRLITIGICRQVSLIRLVILPESNIQIRTTHIYRQLQRGRILVAF